METDADKKPSDGFNDSFKVPSLPVLSKPNEIKERVTDNSSPSDITTDVSDDDQKVPEIESVSEQETATSVESEPEKADNSEPKTSLAQIPAPPFQYLEPSWGGLPDKSYSLEILKNGIIVDTFKLEGKSHFTVGRLPICDVPFEHPSLSRYHAILQFKADMQAMCDSFIQYLDIAPSFDSTLVKESIIVII